MRDKAALMNTDAQPIETYDADAMQDTDEMISQSQNDIATPPSPVNLREDVHGVLDVPIVTTDDIPSDTSRQDLPPSNIW
jgi:hypothetical protein